MGKKDDDIIITSIKYRVSDKEDKRTLNQREVRKLIKYFARREGAVMTVSDDEDGEHLENDGFFGINRINIEKEIRAIQNLKGKFFSMTISLRREDAERLGYNNQKAWADLVKRHVVDFAELHNIPLENYKYFASFHNNCKDSPHIHYVCYSNSKSFTGNINEKSNMEVTKLKDVLYRDIFEFSDYYKYNYKDDKIFYLKEHCKKIEKNIDDIISDYPSDKFISLQYKMRDLARALPDNYDKRYYSNINRNLKAQVDEIIDSVFTNNKELHKLYKEYYEAYIGKEFKENEKGINISYMYPCKKCKSLVITEIKKIKKEGVLDAQKNSVPLIKKMASVLTTEIMKLRDVLKEEEKLSLKAELNEKEKLIEQEQENTQRKEGYSIELQ